MTQPLFTVLYNIHPFDIDVVISFLVLQVVGMHLDGLHSKVALGRVLAGHLLVYL